MEQTSQKEYIVGRNAVLEALKAGRGIDTVYVLEGDHKGSIGKIISLAKDAGAVVKQAGRQLLSAAEKKGRAPFLVIADEIEDPHNLGAIIRTAEACGADGLILPKRRSASLNATVYKTSAGAASVLPVARVANLVSCIRELKKHGIWIYGAEMEGSPWDQLDFTGGTALVIGSEGKGLSRLVKEECDFLATLPMFGQINSLNASVAAGILLYEVVRQRGKQ